MSDWTEGLRDRLLVATAIVGTLTPLLVG